MPVLLLYVYHLSRFTIVLWYERGKSAQSNERQHAEGYHGTEVDRPVKIIEKPIRVGQV